VPLEVVEVESVVDQLPGFSAVLGYPVVSGFGADDDVVVVAVALAHGGKFPADAEVSVSGFFEHWLQIAPFVAMVSGHVCFSFITHSEGRLVVCSAPV
jgi:hypothetical protein